MAGIALFRALAVSVIFLAYLAYQPVASYARQVLDSAGGIDARYH